MPSAVIGYGDTDLLIINELLLEQNARKPGRFWVRARVTA